MSLRVLPDDKLYLPGHHTPCCFQAGVNDVLSSSREVTAEMLTEIVKEYDEKYNLNFSTLGKPSVGEYIIKNLEEMK